MAERRFQNPNTDRQFSGLTVWFPAGPSSNVHSVRRAGNNLHVRFLDKATKGPGRSYLYAGAGYLLGDFRAAPSRGKFVWQVLRRRFIGIPITV